MLISPWVRSKPLLERLCRRESHARRLVSYRRRDHDPAQCPFFKLRLKEVCRELEQDLGLEPVANERQGKTRSATRDEREQARRPGIDSDMCARQFANVGSAPTTGEAFRLLSPRRGSPLGAVIGEISLCRTQRAVSRPSASLPTVEHTRAELQNDARDQHAAIRTGDFVGTVIVVPRTQTEEAGSGEHL